MLEPRQMLAAVIGATNTVDQATALPGDTLTYTVTITNTGDASATGVSFNDAFDPETTFVENSITATPIGFDDVYANVVGNTLLTVNAANGLLANDIDPDDPGAFAGGRLDVKAGSVSRVSGTVSGSTFNVAADGSFTYNPGVGLTGTERFQYTVTDDDNLDSVTVGFIDFTVSSMVWYVDNTAAAGGDGRSGTPFDALADVTGATGPDQTGQSRLTTKLAPVGSTVRLSTDTR